MYQGECNRCGICCQRVRLKDGVDVLYSCANLVKHGDGATSCAKFKTRKTGMRILMVAEHQPLIVFLSRCLVEYPQASHRELSRSIEDALDSSG